MSPIATTCLRHRAVVPAGERCPACASEADSHDAARRTRNNRDRGRNTGTWRRLSALARQRTPYCEECGSERGLTVHMRGGGDHRRASLADVVVLCRVCHGEQDGGGPR